MSGSYYPFYDYFSLILFLILILLFFGKGFFYYGSNAS
ncbi:hypothetical protein J2Z49_001958 [Desulfofundulus luciae]|uniref:Sporulation protein YjcZ n=1 Tax=Desulfofundulus luciae TaxID=74702 RepID=A0ABU0B298_9FIRM|nr:hypothetical protein [Desulfofundulus luciae]